MTFPPKVWAGVLRRLQDELAPVSYEMWIAKISARPAVAASDVASDTVEPSAGAAANAASEAIGHGAREVVELLCPSHFHAVRVRDFFLKPIAEAFEAELGRRVSLRVEVADASAEAGADAPDGTRAETTSDVTPAACDAAEAPPVSSTHEDEATTIRLIHPKNRRTAGTQTISDALGGLLGDLQRDPHGRSIAQQATLQPDSAPPPSPGAARDGGARSDTGFEASTLARPTPPQSAPPAPPASPPGSQSDRTERAPETRRRALPVRIAPAARAVAGGVHGAPPAALRQPTFPLTFDSFTVGPANALAREAAMALASPNPNGGPSSGQLGLNQVFIVSGSGLGKTHLARAATAEGARTIGPRARYTTAESFTSEFTAAIRSDKMNAFKKRYRGECDLLVVDDVQFLEGKAATQLEFFHTVQHVLDSGGRVLLTGDRFPQELTHLDPRVRERIASSVVAEVRNPDDALRGNILRAKAAHGGVRLPDDCIELLVDRVEGSVRELEGALIQLVTVASLFKRPIDLELTRESLEGRTRKLEVVNAPATTQLVIETVAGFFKTTPDALASRSRRRDVLVPRQIAMYLCRRFTDASLADVGRALNRDHPSVANAIRKIERNLLENVRLRYQVEALIARLRERGYRPIHSAD